MRMSVAMSGESLLDLEGQHHGVSQNIAVLLLVGVTVALTVAIGMTVLDFSERPESSAQAGITVSENPNDDTYLVEIVTLGSVEEVIATCDGDESVINERFETVGTHPIEGDCGEDEILITGVTPDGGETVLASGSSATTSAEYTERYILDITMSPDSASYTISNASMDDIDTENLSEGTYTVLVEAEGYEDSAKDLVLEETDKGEVSSLEFDLEAKKYTLDITTVDINNEEMESTVSVSNAAKEEQPDLDDLQPGEYTIDIEKEGYRTISDSVTIEEGIYENTEQYELEPRTYAIEPQIIDSSGEPIPDADYTVYDGPEQKVIVNSSELRHGETYNVSAVAEGYESENKSITVNAHNPEPTLQLSDRTHAITPVVRDGDTGEKLDDPVITFIGESGEITAKQDDAVELDYGTYEYSITDDGDKYNEETGEITVNKDKTISIDIYTRYLTVIDIQSRSGGYNPPDGNRRGHIIQDGYEYHDVRGISVLEVSPNGDFVSFGSFDTYSGTSGYYTGDTISDGEPDISSQGECKDRCNEELLEHMDSLSEENTIFFISQDSARNTNSEVYDELSSTYDSDLDGENEELENRDTWILETEKNGEKTYEEHHEDASESGVDYIEHVVKLERE